MVTAELPFECINEGFALMSDPKTIRIVLRVAQEQV
jgi:Zn-dependent alcohol dehydrogenase